MRRKVLVIEDVPAQQKLLERYLTLKDYAMVLACDGMEAVLRAKQDRPDIIVLDLGLPDIDGIRVCEILKNDKTTRHIPIIIVTARDSASDTVNGLKAGADDYITKPYNHQELMARIEAILRRVSPKVSDMSVIKKGKLMLVVPEQKVMVAKKRVPNITRKEFELLAALVQKSPLIMSKQKLIDTIWGDENLQGEHTLDTHIYNLRKKLGPTVGNKISSVYGCGYKFE